MLKPWQTYGILGLILVIILSTVFLNQYRKRQSDDTTLDAVFERNDQPLIVNEKQPYIFIDIKGAVTQPGVYKLSEDARLFEVIMRAGGLLSTADVYQINQAQKLTDGMHIIIPFISSEPNYLPEISPPQDDTRININTATASLFETLPGIGPARAQTIVEYRNTQGLFESLEALMNVTGIGPETFENLRPFITH